MIKTTLKRLIRKFARPAFKNEINSAQAIAAVYQQSVETGRGSRIPGNITVEGIVFSRDRAMQLHALLSSYYAYVKNPAKLHILYTTTSKENEQSYEQLQDEFGTNNLEFLREVSFKQDVEKLIRGINCTRLFFMTDDGMFIDKFDMNEIIRFDPLLVVPTLIKGLDLTYCYIQDRVEKLPTFIKSAEIQLPEYMRCWEWGAAEPGLDWAYPLSLDTSFYDKDEVQLLIENIAYKGPNTLETALHHAYLPVFLQRKGVCYAKAKYVNIACNVVNREHKNRNTGLHTTAELLQKWQTGYRIRYEDFYGMNCTNAEKASFTFVKR